MHRLAVVVSNICDFNEIVSGRGKFLRRSNMSPD